MIITVHRGVHEIGRSCVEIATKCEQRWVRSFVVAFGVVLL
jgi:hypothetical protein